MGAVSQSMNSSVQNKAIQLGQFWLVFWNARLLFLLIDNIISIFSMSVNVQVKGKIKNKLKPITY